MMSQLAIVPSLNCIQAALAQIVANASYLWERLDQEYFTADDQQSNELEIDRLLNRWCQVVAQGNWDILQKRLRWEGLNLDKVRSRLGIVRLEANQPLPQWAEILRQIMQTAAEFTYTSESFLPVSPDDPIPFEDVLLPAIIVARQRLLAQLGALQLTEASLPLSILSPSAYQALERSLVQRLAEFCTKTLDFEFSQVRPFGQNLLNLLGLEIENNNRTRYIQFVNGLLQDGLLTFFQTYPVLGRLMATAINFWVESTAEFLQRLAQDKAAIQQVFLTVVHSQEVDGDFPRQGDEKLLGKVTAIQTSLSDPHKRGRTVLLLTFDTGLKLVYKPKNMGLEVTFNLFLKWCNQHSQLLDFRVIQVLDRSDYGWVEYVKHEACRDGTAAERFYQRAGMLLCVLYALRGSDCHHENLIASGEHLVLIDMETLLQHEANVIENSPFIQAFEVTAAQQLWDSVLRTGLLPRWDFSADRRIAYDISGLGSTDPQQAPRRVPRWQAINTDMMHWQYESIAVPLEKNVPYLDGITLSANDYQVHIVTGFEQMYRFLMLHKERLLATDSPLVAMRDQQVRFIFRATQIYDTILQNTWIPEFLKHGVDYSVELDRLSCAFLVAQNKPQAWPVLSAELRAMEQLDIPFFTASTAHDELSIEGSPAIPHYFKHPSYQQAVNQLQALDQTDLSRQVAIIQGCFYAKLAQAPNQDSEIWNAESLPWLNSQQWIEAARAIAVEIEARAIPDSDGSVNWISLGYELKAERFQLQVLNDNLYDGRCGIALFLAALHQVTGESRFYNLALQSLQSLRQQIHTFDSESQQRIARLTGIGGAAGLGSMIYTFVKISQFLGDETLMQDAHTLSHWITPELIAADQYCDIISGSAGAILGLLSLYKAIGEAKVLHQAIACGQHLLVHQVSYKGAPRAWQTMGEIPLTGFSHGVAGIAYALLRLYAVTQDCTYLEAALQGIEYERSVFSQFHANWPDLRQLGQIGQPEFLTLWCHGAAGIGLGRLGCSEIANIPEIEHEIEIALQTTQRNALQAIDHLCCGNLGRVEVLLVGAQRRSRPDWHQVALQNATQVLAKAKRTGAYQLFPNLPNSVFNPGFFRGTSGIGYQFLRLAQPEQFPSVLLWE